MARLINAHDLKMAIFSNIGDFATRYKIFDLINAAPSVDKDLMPRGEWQFRYSIDSHCSLDEFSIYCSSCGHEAYVDEGLASYQLFDFCPYCGARMERVGLAANRENKEEE